VQDNDLFDELRTLNLDMTDYAVFGSGPLIVRGIIPETNDLDILCRGRAWQQVQRLGERKHLDKYNVDIVELLEGRLTFGTEWGIGEFDADQLIETAELIGEIPFVQLQYVIQYKRLADRKKDRTHLEALYEAEPHLQ
jgi:predicted nucleotidyltransferase